MTGWLGIPVDIGGPEARELALRELADPVYAEARPPWWRRATDWLWDQIGSALADVAGAASGIVWILVLIAVLTLVALVVARRVGWVDRRRGAGAVFTDRPSRSVDHRAAADAAAARGDWTTATLEIFRALVRTMEERGALDPRPGRTADEASEAGSLAFPTRRTELLAAARTFDLVAYGGRAGTSEGYHRVAELDGELERSALAEQWA